MGKPAARKNDQLVGVGMHIVKPAIPQLPPFPVPFPFNGTLKQLTSFNVRIQKKPAAMVLTQADNKPKHIPPPGTSFVPPPTNKGFVLKGSRNVRINMRPAARQGDAARLASARPPVYHLAHAETREQGAQPARVGPVSAGPESLEALLAGEKAAWDRFVARFAPVIFAAVRRRLVPAGRGDEAEDGAPVLASSEARPRSRARSPSGEGPGSSSTTSSGSDGIAPARPPRSRHARVDRSRVPAG